MKPSIRIVVAAAVTALVLVGATAAAGAPPSDRAAAPAQPASQQLQLASAVPVPEQQFVAIEPCRIADSRTATTTGKKPYASGQTRQLGVVSPAQLAVQGGRATGCGIPDAANALSVSLSAVAPTSGGYLRAWPTGRPEPGATLLNFTARQGMTSGATVKIDNGVSRPLTVKSYGATHVVIDVTGYYLPPIFGTFTSNGSMVRGSGRISLVSHAPGSGAYQLQVDRDVASCVAIAVLENTAGSNVTAYHGSTTHGVTDPTLIRVNTTGSTGTPADLDFSIALLC